MNLEPILSAGWLGYLAPPILLLVIFALHKAVEDARTFSKYRYPGVVSGAIPFLGNAHQIPKTGQAKFFTDLAKQHGEMMTLRLGSTPWLFINSRRVATELLQKRANIYSSRQMLPMAQDVVSKNNRILLMPYDDLWRRERKILHQLLNVTNMPKFSYLQEKQSQTLLKRYLKDPEQFYLANSNYSNSVATSIAFGRSTEMDDLDLKEFVSTSAAFVKYLQPNSSIVDLFPFLARLTWLPRSCQPWRWAGDKLYQKTLNVYKKQIAIMKSRLDNGEDFECFMKDFIQSGEIENFSDEQTCFLAGVILEAGSDTTRVSLHQVVAGSALHPDWLARARVELDAVCGSNAERLPKLSDQEKLPLIKAAVKESVRWKPAIAETGIPHALTKDDTFEGYRLKAGTVVTWNHWAISNSELEYDEPERFWPDRFLGDDLDNASAGHLGFGAGRRLCVGLNVGQTNMFIAIARLVYCFDFEEDPEYPIDVSKPFIDDDVNGPFKVKIRPRSTAHAELIERTNEEGKTQ